MSNQLSVSQMEEILLREPHIVSISRDPDYNVPEINLALWTKEYRKGAQRRIDSLIKVLHRPYIEDDFGNDHMGRIKWQERLGTMYYWFFDYIKSNALKRNSFVDVSKVMDEFDFGYIGTNIAQFKKLKEGLDVLTPSDQEYQTLSNTQKIERVRTVRSKVYEILEFLSQQSSVNPS